MDFLKEEKNGLTVKIASMQKDYETRLRDAQDESKQTTISRLSAFRNNAYFCGMAGNIAKTELRFSWKNK